MFKTNECVKPRCVKTLYGDGKKPSKIKIQKKSEENINSKYRKSFWTKKGKWSN